MICSSLVERLLLGEDSTLALKCVDVARKRVRSPDPDDFADELAAMANGRGGTVLLGVDSRSREVLGIALDDLDTVERWVRKVCNDSVKPVLDADIRTLTMQDASSQSVPIIRIDLARSLFVHESPGGHFRRVGSSKREIAPDVLVRLFQERSFGRQVRFDETVVSGTARSDLNYALARRFIQASPTEDTLRKLRVLARDDDEVDRLTIAGVLLCTSAPQRWLTHAYIQAVSYAGERLDSDCQTDARDIMGPLDEQVSGALNFVMRNMFVRSTKHASRSDRPQFSERAVFEALVNAVAHRDYSMAGARIRLQLFADRLELLVPGRLAGTLTPDSLHLRQSK